MPFTLSHIIAIHPFRKRLPLDSLIIGSIVPDTSYFLPLGISRSDSHTILSIITYSLPIGLILLLSYRVFLQRPLRHIIRYNNKSTTNDAKLTYVIKSLLGLLIGIAIHLIWDYLTHLSNSNIYQHISSLIGILLLIIIVIHRRERWKLKPVLYIISGVLIVISLFLGFISLDNNSGSIVRWYLYWIIFFGGKCLLSTFLVYTLIYNIKSLLSRYR